MKLLDSNIIIYSYQTAFNFLKSLVVDQANVVSAMTKLEVLGFHGLKPDEQLYCENVFSILQILPIEQRIIEKAIELRRQYKLKSADSIVAATGLIYNVELYTRNVSDFGAIAELKVVNPIP
jgi:hypothetical protein